MTHSQLEGFRQVLGARRKTNRAKSFAIASGKGGVGKSTLALGLSMGIARQGRQVLLLDGDAGLADLNILLGINPPRHWGHFIEGQCSFAELLVNQVHGIDFVHGFSGVSHSHWMQGGAMEKILEALRQHSDQHDFQIIDVGAGLSESSLAFCTSVDLLLLVLGRELTALADGYGTLKTVLTRNPRQKIGIVVNGARDADQARQVYANLMKLAHQFLGVRPPLLAWLPEDPSVPQALLRQKPVLDASPTSPWSQSVLALATALAGQQSPVK